MNNEKFKVLEIIDGNEYIFNAQAFSAAIKKVGKYKVEKKEYSTITAFYEAFANKILVSESAVKQWMRGANGVSDLVRVREIAEILEIGDYRKLLMKKGREENNMIDVEERNAAKAVFEIMTEVILMYKWTDGLVGGFEPDYRHETENGYYSLELEAEKTIKKARFDLPKEIFEQVDNLYQEIMCTLPEDVDWGKTPRDRVLMLDHMVEEFFEKLYTCMARYLH